MSTPLNARQDIDLTLAVGVIYTVVVTFGGYIVAAFGGTASPTIPELMQDGLKYVVPLCLLRIVPASFLMAGFISRASTLRAALLWPNRARIIAGLVVGTAAVSVLLDALGVSPWAWRHPANTTVTFLRTLVDTRQALAVLLIGFTWIVVIPAVEEAVYRFGLLRYVTLKTGSPTLGVTLSAVAFGLAHSLPLLLGPLGENSYALFYGTWTAAFGLVLGFIVIRSEGSILGSFAIHSTRNAIELLALLVFLTSSSRP